FRLGENFVLAFATLLELATLALVKGAASPGTFATPSLELVNTAVRVYGDTFNIGFVFLGFGSAGFCYLWLKSGYIPWRLGRLGVFASLIMALMSLAIIVLLALAKLGLTYMLPMGL